MKKVAVFTLTNNQPEFQEIWIKYYSQFNFHLVILEHVLDEKEEGIVQDTDEYEHHKVFHAELFDHSWMNGITHIIQRQLLKKYETVIYTDIDELIIPENCNLKEYCEKNDYKYPMCKQITLDEYIKNINTGVLDYDLGYGFDIKLLSWDESWIFEYPERKRDNNILEDMKSRNKLIDKNINFFKLKKCIDNTDPGYIVKCN